MAANVGGYSEPGERAEMGGSGGGSEALLERQSWVLMQLLVDAFVGAKVGSILREYLRRREFHDYGGLWDSGPCQSVRRLELREVKDIPESPPPMPSCGQLE